MSSAPGIGERLLALEKAVAMLTAELQAELHAGLAGPATPAVVTGEPTDLVQLAQQLENGRLAAVLARAGFGTIAAVVAASDDQLRAIDGVSEKALRVIREKVASTPGVAV